MRGLVEGVSRRLFRNDRQVFPADRAGAQLGRDLAAIFRSVLDPAVRQDDPWDSNLLGFRHGPASARHRAMRPDLRLAGGGLRRRAARYGCDRRPLRCHRVSQVSCTLRVGLHPDGHPGTSALDLRLLRCAAGQDDERESGKCRSDEFADHENLLKVEKGNRLKTS
jgi:hypothetical protein